MQFNLGDPLGDIKDQYITNIKEEAHEVITSVYPVWKQLNLQAEYNTAPPTRKAQIDAIHNWIKTIRTGTDLYESYVDGCANAIQIRKIMREFGDWIDDQVDQCP